MVSPARIVGSAELSPEFLGVVVPEYLGQAGSRMPRGYQQALWRLLNEQHPADFILAAFALAWSLDSTHTPNVATELDLMTLFKPLSRLKSEGTKYLHVLKAPNRLTAQQRYHS